MVFQKRWEDAWQGLLLRADRSSELCPTEGLDDPHALLMRRIVDAARLYKQKQQQYLRYHAAAATSPATKTLAEQAYSEARQAQRQLFTEIMRLEALESDLPSEA